MDLKGVEILKPHWGNLGRATKPVKRNRRSSRINNTSMRKKHTKTHITYWPWSALGCILQVKETARKNILPTGFCDSHHFIQHPHTAKNLLLNTRQHPTDLKFPFKQSCGYADSKDSTWIILPPILRQMQQKTTPAYLRKHVSEYRKRCYNSATTMSAAPTAASLNEL